MVLKVKDMVYNFDTIEVASVGDRDPDAEGVSGMSASKMRNAACNQMEISILLKKVYHLVSKMVKNFILMLERIWVFVKRKIWVR